ncbi:hypothetical protein [Nocardia sp. NPDC052566]|uniref:hypothetical protein n=1 Tax=Nocardia sp. NPDC052566 TaxID=3364330 RepID=UPI0037C81E8F
MEQLRRRLHTAAAMAERPLDIESATRLRDSVLALSRELDTGHYFGDERTELSKLRDRALRKVELAAARAGGTPRAGAGEVLYDR